MADVSLSGVILKVNTGAFKREKPFDIQLYGKTLLEWVALSLGGAPFICADYDGETEIPLAVKPYLGDSEYTAVLFSDTPLLQKRTVLEALEHTANNGLNVCRMTRGYIFKTDFLKTVDRVLTTKRQYFSEEEDFLTATDFERLAFIGDVMRQRILSYHMRNGVQITDPSSVLIEGDAVIGAGTVISAGNRIKGRTVIGENVILNENNNISDCVIANGATLTSSTLIKSYVGEKTVVGPYAYIRPECVVGDGCRIGDFVELKRSKIGAGCKISHLAYVGDCETGDNCNIGCGAVTVNFDGVQKHKTIMGSGVFVGSNCNLVAPITLGDNAFIAAGSTITDGVPSRALAIARARQINKPDWVED